MVDELEVVEGFTVWRSINVWAVEGRGRLVVNVGLGQHWKGGIVKKEGRRGRRIASVEVIVHGSLPSWVVKASEASLCVSLGLLITRYRVQTRALWVWGQVRGGEGRVQGSGWIIWGCHSNQGPEDNSRPNALIGWL